MVFQLIEDNLRGNEPSVQVTVNEYCSNTNVNVSFGEREKGSNNSCDLQDFQSATLAPDVAMKFYVNETIVMLSDGYEYCFNISSFQEPSCEFIYCLCQLLSLPTVYNLCASIAVPFPNLRSTHDSSRGRFHQHK